MISRGFRFVLPFMSLGLLAACAVPKGMNEPLDTRVGMQNAANIRVAQNNDGTLSLLYPQPDGSVRRAPLPAHIESVEVLDSRERRGRREYAALLRVNLRPGHPSECPAGMPVERLMLSEARHNNLLSPPRCGELVQLEGGSDGNTPITVLFPNGTRQNVVGSRMMNPSPSTNTREPSRAATTPRVMSPPASSAAPQPAPAVQTPARPQAQPQQSTLPAIASPTPTPSVSSSGTEQIRRIDPSIVPAARPQTPAQGQSTTAPQRPQSFGF